MPNEFKSREAREAYVLKILTEELARISSAKEIERFLSALLTAREKKQMVGRVMAASLLRQGRSYREIGEATWLSPTTISAVRKSLLAKEGYISRHTRKEKQ